jgi:galactose oxidase
MESPMTISPLRHFALRVRQAFILALQAFPVVVPASASAQPSVVGEWSPVFDTQNVMIHASVLPSGKVLFWSRREASDGTNLNPHVCTTRIFDPSLIGKPGMITFPRNQPGYNLFCSSHAFLPDGRLLVAGGHISDGHGVPHASVYDPMSNMWSPTADMSGGRWYPTATPLPDGSVLVSFGTDEHGNNNVTQQVWKDGALPSPWRSIVQFDPPPYYPRMHVVSDGRVFMTGPLPLTQFLDTSGMGTWTFLHPDPDINKAVALSSRINNLRDYAPSVLYDVDKIVFIGGGIAPTNAVEVLDLNVGVPQWTAKPTTDPMEFARRQHNATLLPDGTVLVMGGTQGSGGNGLPPGFNDLTPGQPIHSAELWDPKTGHWTLMAKAAVDRCYHSTAVLLPDATVLSAGGGEYSPRNDGQQNDPQDTHKDAQIFTPPYLFRASPRPDILAAPATVTYGQTFTVGTSAPSMVGQVNWVCLSSVTHSFNTNQRINFLKFTAGATSLSVTAPANANLCLPGHYMLFVLNKDNVPSVAKVIQIQ